MKKGLSIALALLMVVALAALAMAEEISNETDQALDMDVIEMENPEGEPRDAGVGSLSLGDLVTGPVVAGEETVEAVQEPSQASEESETGEVLEGPAGQPTEAQPAEEAPAAEEPDGEQPVEIVQEPSRVAEEQLAEEAEAQDTSPAIEGGESGKIDAAAPEAEAPEAPAEEQQPVEEQQPAEGAPVANALVYTGEAQPLVSAGGAWLYALDGVTYGMEIPTAVNAGEYTVYYKAAEDAEAQTLIAIIDKADVLFTPPVAATGEM